MIRFLRRTRTAALAAVVTLACVASLSAASLVHSGADDPDCSPVLVLHDHSAHRFTAPAESGPAQDHCFICHWQFLRIIESALTFEAPPAESRAIVRTETRALDPEFLTHRPARAPPASRP